MNRNRNPVSYIQHPSNIPLQLSACHCHPHHRTPMPLGLICHSDTYWEGGDYIELKSPLAPEVHAQGQILWCRRHHKGYQIAIAFYSSDDLYRIRMLEQLCHINHYHKQQKRQGKVIPLDVAANEWIEKFAAHFPADGL